MKRLKSLVEENEKLKADRDLAMKVQAAGGLYSQRELVAENERLKARIAELEKTLQLYSAPRSNVY